MTNNKIYVLSYNVSWGAMSGNKNDKTVEYLIKKMFRNPK